ncbi:MAG: hypothetical protein WCZ22_03700, partial [Dehalococcoidales bacterium]
TEIWFNIRRRYSSPINRDFVPFYGTQHSARIHLLLSAHPELVEGHERLFSSFVTLSAAKSLNATR